MAELPFLDGLRRVPNEYRPVPFWFLNHFLREDELRRQIREMAAKGFGGIMLHARDGLRSGYLNGEWRQAVQWCIDEAEEQDMTVWLYDELHYPSGRAGGRMFDYFPDSMMQSLEAVLTARLKPGETASFDDTGREIRYAWAVAEDGGAEEIPKDDAANWTNGTGRPVTLLILADDREMSLADKYPDPLDPKVAGKFVELSYEWYAREFGEYFGNVIKGEFTDNSCFNFGETRRAIPWTADLPERFARKTGKDLSAVMPGLFLDTTRCREDRLLFWKFVGDEYLESFVIPIERSCEKNGIQSTGHYCLETADSEHIRQLGDRFDLKRRQALPAVDMLGFADRSRMKDLLRMKGTDAFSVSIPGTSCVAYWHKDSRVMCECMGLSGGWGLDLAEITRATGLLAVLGIDLFVPHGLYYSIAGHRKWEDIPDHFHNPMWEFYREWTDWIAKLSYLASHGERTSQTALLYPATAQRAYLELGVAPARGKAYATSDRGAVCDLIDFTWVAAGNALVENNIAYDIVDETLIQSARVEDGTLRIRAANGKDMAFTALILPCAKILERKTVETLGKWRASGGSVIALNADVEDVHDAAAGTLEPAANGAALHDFRVDFESESDFAEKSGPLLDLIRQKTIQPILASGHSGKVVSKHWRKWGYDFYLLHNASDETIRDVEIVLRGETVPCRLNLRTAAVEGIPGRSDGNEFSFTWDFPPAHSLLLVSGKDIQAPERASRKKRSAPAVFPIEGNWEFRTFKPNVFPLRSCIMETQPACKRYTYRFDVENIPAEIGLAVDCEMKDQEFRFDRYLARRLKCFLNGTRIETRPSAVRPGSRAPWAPTLVESFRPGKVFDRWMFETDIAGLVKPGTNELVITLAAGHLDENRACDMPLLFGDFVVIGEKVAERIAAPTGQRVSGDWRAFGYPYYSGMAAYLQRVRLPDLNGKKRLVLSLGDLANAAEVLIDGKSIGRKILPPWEYDLSGFIGAKELEIEVRVINTAKNLWDDETLPSGLLGPVELRAFS